MESSNNGSEYKNITDTWDENERRRAKGETDDTKNNVAADAPAENDLEQLIKQEASEYDNANKEERILGGDRATVNDDDATGDTSDV